MQKETLIKLLCLEDFVHGVTGIEDSEHFEYDNYLNVIVNRYNTDYQRLDDDYVYHTLHHYFKNVVVPHKIAVYKAGLGIISKLRLIEDDPLEIGTAKIVGHNLYMHDLSKFSVEEAYGYAFHDFASKEVDPEFDKAWLHHKHHNPHHPEYWLSVNRAGNVTTMDMPYKYIIEMVADWMGAGEVYGNSIEEWLPENYSKFLFSENTDKLIKKLLTILDIEWVKEKNHL